MLSYNILDTNKKIIYFFINTNLCPTKLKGQSIRCPHNHKSKKTLIEYSFYYTTKCYSNTITSIIILNNISIQSIEPFRKHLGHHHNQIKLLLGIFFIIALPRDSNPHPIGHTLDTLTPYGVVKIHIIPYIDGSHGLL
jgi:hypothetical protein